NTNANDWHACREGELQTLATRLRNSERRQRQLASARLGGVTAGVTACLVFGFGMLFAGGPMSMGGLSCSECKANFDAYHGHLVLAAALDSDLAEQMDLHLEKCVRCRDLFDEKYPTARELSGLSVHDLWRPASRLGYAAAY
ncbi:MAG: hypothetical protein AAGG46_12975, partial [Planctomycetota bacterium]